MTPTRRQRRATGATRSALLIAAMLALAACEPGTGPFSALTGKDTDGPRTQRSTRLVDRDVEAPEVFQTTDTALWDGRPSLGGVWVAAPGVTDPERVIMRNVENGKFVIGALFRRERENPGPPLQISSDAADALGLLAGQPARISVTALRREEVPEETPAAPVLDTAEVLPEAAGAAATVTAVPLDAPAKAAGATPAEAAPSAPAATTPATAERPPTGAGVIQIGFFSVEENAQRAVRKLASAGIRAEIRHETTKGKDYWSVFARGDRTLLESIRKAGFSDAYVSR